MRVKSVIAIDVGDVYKVLGGEKEDGTTGDMLEQATQIAREGRNYFSLAVLRGEFADTDDLIRVASTLFHARRNTGGGATYSPIPNTEDNQKILAAALNPAVEALDMQLDALISRAAAYCREHTPPLTEMSGLQLVLAKPF